ncbi:sodium-coupled monocarboxylate transporter 1-like [Chironomus tepperi]
MARNFYLLLSDYLLFIIVVAATTVIPLWSRFFGKKKTRTKADYVFATGAVSAVSMMLSIARGTLGVRSFLGFPSEQFYRGAGMWETLYGMVTAYPIVAFVFIPVYFNLGITSVYQYIELRFNSRLVRCLASGTYIFRSILNLGVTVFTPTVALYTIIGIPIWMSLLAITIISILFNLLGGLKQAITADVIQVVVTIVVSVAIIIQSTIIAGGVTDVLKENYDSGRLNFFNFTGSMKTRVDTTSAWLGQLFMSLSLFGCQQNFVQRYLSMKSIKQVTRMLMLNIPVIIFLFSLSWIVGMCIYSVYSDCDPLKFGYTKSADAILPFYIQDKYSFIPGLIGIFLSTLFNSALILNVSNLNSLATVTWEDFLSHLPQFKGMPDKKQLKIIKFIGSVYGLMIMGVGFSVQLLSGVIESAQLMTSATSGPLLGVFLLAILVPFANWKGASVGMIMSHLIILSITFGHLQVDKSVQFLETSITGCTNATFSSDIQAPAMSMLINLSHNNPIVVDHWMENTTKSALMQSTAAPLQNLLNEIFSISYMYYSCIGTCITVVIGSIVSLLTMSKDDAYESKYIHQFVFKLTKVFPGYCYLFSDEHQLTDSLQKHSPKGKSNVIVEHDNYAFDIKSEETKDSSMNGSNITHVVSDVHNQMHECEKYRKLEDV